MPFCPKCRYEYRPEISECPDCAERLVATLPLEPEESDVAAEPYDWIPLAKMTSPQYAEMIIETLRSKDIPALISDSSGHLGQTGQMGTSSFNSMGGAATVLLVPREFAADASREAEVILGEEWNRMKLGDF